MKSLEFASYKFKSSLPTISESKGICLINPSKFYFCSNYCIFSSNDLYTPILIAPDIIKDFYCDKERIAVVTEKHIYLLKDSAFDRSYVYFTIKADKIFLYKKYLVTTDENILYIWELPTEYKFTLFKRIHKMNKHSKKINSIDINNGWILTTSDDNVIIATSIESLESKVVWKSKYKIKFARITQSPTLQPNDQEKKFVPSFIAGSTKTSEIFLRPLDKNLSSIDFTKGAISNNKISLDGKVILFSSAVIDGYYVVVVKDKENDQLYSVLLFNNLKMVATHEFIDDNPMEVYLINDKNVFIGLKFNNRIIVMCLVYDKLEIFSEFILFNKIQSFSISSTKLAIKDSDSCYILDRRTKRLIKEIKISGEGVNNEIIEEKDKQTTLIEKSSNKKKIKLSKFNINYHFIKITDSTLFVVNRKGLIKVFNINDYRCYRTHQIPIEIEIEKIAISDDSQLLLILNETTISVFNVKTNKIFFTYNHSSPIINFQFYKEFVYFIDLDYNFIKLHIFSDGGKADYLLQSDSPYTDFIIKNNFIYLAGKKEIEIYTINMEYIRSLLSNNENIDSFIVIAENDDLCRVFINTKKTIDVFINNNYLESLSLRDTKVDEMAVSLDDEITVKYDNHQLCFYRRNYDRICFYNNDINRIDEYLQGKNYFQAITTALQLNDTELLKRVLLNAGGNGLVALEATIKVMGDFEVIEFYNSLKVLVCNKNMFSLKLKRITLISLKHLFYYHKNILPINESYLFKELIREDYKIIRDNFFMLSVLKNE